MLVLIMSASNTPGFHPHVCVGGAQVTWSTYDLEATQPLFLYYCAALTSAAVGCSSNADCAELLDGRSFVYPNDGAVSRKARAFKPTHTKD